MRTKSTLGMILGLLLTAPFCRAGEQPASVADQPAFRGTIKVADASIAPEQLTVCFEDRISGGREEENLLLTAPVDKDGAFALIVGDKAKSGRLYIRDAQNHIYRGFTHLNARKGKDFGEIEIRRDCTVTAKVLNPEKQILADTPVKVSLWLESGCKHHYLPLQTIKTDAEGLVTLEGISPGKYHVQVHDDEWSPTDNTVTVEPEDFAYIELHVKPGAALTGRITGPDGEPVAGVVVKADGSSSAPSNAEGVYRLAGLAGDSYWVRVEADGMACRDNQPLFVELTAGDILTRNISLLPTGSLKIVFEQETPQVQVPAQAQARLSVPNKYSAGYRRLKAPVQDGQAVLDNIAPGTYRLALTDGACGDTQTPVEVRAGQQTEVVLKLPRLFSFAGTLTDDADEPLAGARIMYRMGDGNRYHHAESDQEGLFRIRNVPAGTLRLDITHERIFKTQKTVPIGDEEPLNKTFVIDAGDGVLHGTVAIVPDRPAAEAQLRVSLKQGKTKRIRADDDGSYRVPGLPAGEYTIRVTHDEALELAETLTLGVGEEKAHDFVLKKGLVVGGVVQEADGTPATGVRVFVYGPNNNTGPRQYVSRGTVVDEDGKFLLQGLFPGTYRLTVNENDAPVREAFSMDDCQAGDTELLILLSKALIVPVMVTGPEGKPLAGARLVVSRVREGFSQMYFPHGNDDGPLTDAEGKADLSLRAGSKYTIRAASAPLLPARQTVDLTGGEAPQAPLALPLTRGQPLAGTVTDADGNPLAGYHVFASTPNGFGQLEVTEDTPRTTTDEKGQFLLQGLPSGLLSVTVSVDKDGEQAVASKRVQLAAETPERKLTFRVATPGTVAGHIDVPPDTKHSIARIMQPQKGTSRNAPIDADGSFRFENLPPGTYMLYVMVVGEDSSNVQPQMRQVTVRSGETAEVDFGAPADARKVSGTVTLLGKPIAEARLCLIPIPEEGFGPTAFMSMRADIRNVTTDREGQFAIQAPPAGRVLAQLQIARPNQPDFATYAQTVAFDQEQERLDIAYTGTTVNGTVLDTEGAPLPDANITLIPTDADMLTAHHIFASRTRTDEKGAFSLACVQPGTYKCQAAHDQEGQTTREGLEVGQESQTVEIRMQPGVAISGSVVSGEGKALAQARIFFMDKSRSCGGVGMSDPEGNYTLNPALPAGQYRAFALLPGYSLNAAVVTVADAETTHNFTLVPAGGLRVVLQGDAVSGRTLLLRNARGEDVPRLRDQSLAGVPALASIILPLTDEDGTAVINGLAPGQYTIGVEGSDQTVDATVKALDTVEVTLKTE
jgi:protocatechuate 3,4-dioxygenase beta subunit